MSATNKNHITGRPAEPTFSSLFADFSFDKVLWVMFRHKWKIFLCVALGVFAALVIMASAPKPEYRSESKLLVRFFRENVKLDPSSKTDQIISDQSWDRIINSEIELLKSRELAEKVVNALAADRVAAEAAGTAASRNQSMEFFARIGTRLKRMIHKARSTVKGENAADRRALSAREREIMGIVNNLETNVSPSQNIIHVLYTAESPGYAQDVLQNLIELYLEKHMEVHSAAGSHEFFVRQAETLREELDGKQEELRGLRNTFEVASLNAKEESVTRRVAELESDRERKEAALAAATARVQALELTLADLEEKLPDSPESPGLHSKFAVRTYDRLIELQLQEEDLLATYTEQSLPVQKVRQKIARMGQILERGAPNLTGTDVQMTSASDGYNQTFLALLGEQENRSAYIAEIGELERQLENAQVQLRRLNEGQMKVGREEQNVDILKESYRKYMELAEQARIDQARDREKIANISIVQQPSDPYIPVPSSVPWHVGLALFLGLAGGLGSAMLTEFVLDRSIKTSDDVRKWLHVPSLAVIPRARRGGGLISARKVSIQPQLQQSDGMSATGVWDIPVNVKDYYDTLAEVLLASATSVPGKPVTIGVTSWSRNEGVSTIAANLGVTLAEYDGRVLLVETDIRNPTAHEIFGQVASPGLTEIDVDGLGRATVLQHNLYLLPAHEISGRREQVSVPQKRCNDLMVHFQGRQDYGFIVVDMPPLCEGAAALRLARMTENVVLVVEAERHSRDAIQHGLSMLEQINANVLGAVLNKRRRHVPRFLSSSSY